MMCMDMLQLFWKEPFNQTKNSEFNSPISRYLSFCWIDQFLPEEKVRRSIIIFSRLMMSFIGCKTSFIFINLDENNKNQDNNNYYYFFIIYIYYRDLL